jgi:hypothetical protein
MRAFACLALLASAAACIKEPCRAGTVYVTVEFLDSWDRVDGVAIRYQLDDGPLTDINPPVTRPAGKDRGGLELQVKDYAKYKKLTLHWAPTKGNVIVGDWQSKSGTLASSTCGLATLSVGSARRDAGTGMAPDSIRADSGAPDAMADLGTDVSDLGPSTGPDAQPDASPDLAPDLAPDGESDALPDLGVELGRDSPPDSGPDAMPDRLPPISIDVMPKLDFGPDSPLGLDSRPEVPLIVGDPPDMGRDIVASPDLMDALLTTVGTTSLAFGSIPVGSSSSVQGITITNRGQRTSGTIVLSSNSTDFVVTASPVGDCQYSVLEAGASCTIAIFFRPTAIGDRSSTVGFSAGTPGTSGSVSLFGTGIAGATLNVAPGGYTFPDTAVGSVSSNVIFTVTNSAGSTTDSGPMSISLVGPNAADFMVVANACTAPLVQGATCSIALTFTPTAKGQRTAQLNVVSSKATAASASLSGLGLPQIEIVPESSPGFDFGQTPVTVAGTTIIYDVWVRGAGAQTTNTLSVALVDPATPPNFVMATDTCSANPAKSPSLSFPACQLSVQFYPQAGKGVKTATLTVLGSSGSMDQKTLTGTATSPLAFFPGALDFGQVAVGYASQSYTFTLLNSGSLAQGPLVQAMGGSDATQFALVSDTCSGQVLSGGASCEVRINFSPTTLGSRTATYSMASGGEAATIALRGQAVAAPVLSVTPSPYDFGSVARGSKGGFVAFTVSSTGSTLATGPIFYQLTGGADSDFELANGGNTLYGTCGISGGAQLQPAQLCTIKAAFAPTSATTLGTRATTLRVQASPGGVVDVPLTATAIP